ncbi:hypothetical protein LZK98_11965 [Sphingomonas cannabina]|uniref:hypothetical protein n=1 Tax=Sphingomonas cannabina TaxID=2899123 RepID=UPI001F1EE0C0|nr:hypothetical protein [Sphingomonas cannabina]UIJ43808.1 hypothetical protein LZK98_11965 [Sphingomonas cannabina]
MPQAALVEKLTTPKPKPEGDIVNDDTAAATYSAQIETWGDTVYAAGVAMCGWLNSIGGKFDCPKP